MDFTYYFLFSSLFGLFLGGWGGGKGAYFQYLGQNKAFLLGQPTNHCLHRRCCLTSLPWLEQGLLVSTTYKPHYLHRQIVIHVALACQPWPQQGSNAKIIYRPHLSSLANVAFLWIHAYIVLNLCEIKAFSYD